ncbi:MAG: hypothetical protein NC181_00385 [Clostridium sp.]|nr:hypothetical protein [Clostridium sp.]MCM1443878.1 hypothetical protein [Candidatus Amulumruptor caecigallinarius]
MRCPNCNSEIEYGIQTCPYCNNILFQGQTDENIQQIDHVVQKIKKTLVIISKVNKILVIGGAITIFVVLLIAKALSYPGIFNFTAILNIVDIVLKTMLGVGIICFIIFLILFIVKKRVKIVKKFGCISLIFIIVPLLTKSVIKINGDFSLKDYSKAEYIELGAEQIPSIYSVVGKRKVLINYSKNDKLEENLDIIIDVIGIIYLDLSNDDKVKYNEALIDYGFSEETIYNPDENEYQKMLVKNGIKDNSFYVVVIDGLSITYSKGDGMYQNVLQMY